MSTIITRNSANSGSTPSSLIQGELAINVTDGKLFYGSGSGNIVKEFTGSGGGGGAIDTGSFATTGSNIFIGNQIITGSLHQSGTFYPDQIDWFSSSIGYDTGSYILTTTINGLTTYAGYSDVADKLAPYIPTVSSSVSASFATLAQTANTASYVENAQTASYVLQAVSASYATTASYSNTSTSASYAITASYALNALSASYATNGGVTQIIAGPNITVSPTTGVGQVTISSTGGGGGTGNTATGSYGSFYDTTIQTNVASTARSMSLNTTDITNGVSISGSTNPYNTYIKTENAGVYDIQFSAQVDKTDSGTDEIWIWLRKNGINVTDSATSIQLVGNGAHYVAAWNFFVNAAANDYFQLMWYSPDANVRLHAEAGFGVVPGIPSLIVTANRVDQFLSNTGSFSGSFTGNLIGTASYVENAQTASYVLQAVSASYATTASYSNTSTSASYASTASYVENAQTASYVTLAQTASYALDALSASWAPGGTSTPTFPYTGSAIISGSLELTGSLLVQDINGKTNIDSSTRQLYVAPLFPPEASSVLSVDWGSRTLNDTNGNSSVSWRNRDLLTSNGAIGLDWTDDTYLNSDVYQRDYKSAATQDAVSTYYSNPGTSYLGDVIESDGITTVIDSTVTEGMLVYLYTDATWYPVNQAATGATKLLGIAHNLQSLPPNPPPLPTNQFGSILLEGHVVIDDTSLLGPNVQNADHGLPIYIRDGTTQGLMSTTVPSTTSGNNVVRVLGHCYQQNSGTATQWIMKFRPSNDWVEI